MVSMEKLRTMYLWFVNSSFILGTFLVSAFLFFGAYNPAGEGIVLFKNSDDAIRTGSNVMADDGDNFDKINRGFYVGFDRICFPESLDPGTDIAATATATKCIHYHAAEHGDDDMTQIIWFTWIIWTFGVVHILLAFLVYLDLKFADFLFKSEHPVARGVYAILFYAPIVFFVLSVILWNNYIGNTDTIPYKSGGDENEVVGSGMKIGDINGIMNEYKDKTYTTWSVYFLLAGEAIVAFGCVNNFMNSVRTDGPMGLIQTSFIGSNASSPVAATVGATVDPAAKDPETKKNAVTSVYANRRVTNGIAF